MILFGRVVLLAAFLALFPAGFSAAETVHVVARGDTVFSLSRSHGVSQAELMRRNGLTDPGQLRLGMRQFIPAAPPLPAPPAAARSEHTVSPGETLFGIARGNGVTLQALREINGFSAAHVLRAGERILIPFPAVAVLPGPQVNPRPPTETVAPQAPRWPIQAIDVANMRGNSRGVLILGRESESVRSISRGTVVYAGPWRGYGNVVIVESAGGFRFLYGANESLSVRTGDSVEPGTEIGKLGIHPATGRPELVFAVSRHGLPVDPRTAPRS